MSAVWVFLGRPFGGWVGHTKWAYLIHLLLIKSVGCRRGLEDAVRTIAENVPETCVSVSLDGGNVADDRRDRSGGWVRRAHSQTLPVF